MSFDSNDPNAPSAGPTQPAGPPSYGAGQPTAPYGAPQPTGPQYPGPGSGGAYMPVQQPVAKGLSIAGLVCAIIPCVALVGLILSIVALVKSRKAGQSNGIALAGIIVGAVVVIGSAIAIALGIAGLIDIAQTCSDLGDGTHYVNGRTYTCAGA